MKIQRFTKYFIHTLAGPTAFVPVKNYKSLRRNKVVLVSSMDFNASRFSMA